MRLLYKIIVLSMVAISITTIQSCSKKLELVPNNQLLDVTAFDTPDRCLLALYGVYDAAQSGVYDPLNGSGTSDRGYPFGAAALSQSEMRGEDMVNIAAFYQITYQSTYSPTTPNNVNMWKELYALINKANLSIEGFRAAAAKGVLSASVAAQYEGECRFLRALAHHELVINFARPFTDGNGDKLGVPYHDYAINSSSALERLRSHARETVAANYTKMLADLDYAETNLPALISGSTPTSDNANTYRATKAAAIALKMRLRMHMADWNGLITEGNKLIPASLTTTPVSPIGGWSLTPTPIGPFGITTTSVENIFSIRNDPNDNPGVNAAIGKMFGPADAAAGARGLVAISPIIWNNSGWRCDDKRRAMITSPLNLNNGGTQSLFTSKYRDYVNGSDYTPIIRYAEVILMQAEAEARKASGVSQRAIDLMNAVRNRALQNPATDQYTAASFATNTDLVKAILLERRIEFLAEGKRWGDIHRLATDATLGTGGIPGKVANGFSGLANYSCGGAQPPIGTAAIPYSDYRFLWPIPQQELTTNPAVEKNPGY